MTIARPTTRDDSSRKPIYNEASTAGPEPPPANKRPLSNPVQVVPSRSLSELKTLNLGSTLRESEDVPMRDISDDNQFEQPRKRAAIGDGISAGSASPLPFRDSESPPPRRSKARPTSAPLSTSETDMRRPGGKFDETLQRPHVVKKTLWTPDQDSPLTRSSFDPSNIASVQTQKSRNQALQSKSRKSYQSPQQTSSGSRLPAQSPPNLTPAAIFGKASNQSSQSQPKDEVYDIVLQPETRPISQEQLVAEVKGSKSLPAIHCLHFRFSSVVFQSSFHSGGPTPLALRFAKVRPTLLFLYQ